MPHSIFIKERAADLPRPPELIAYDIDSVALANRLVRSIAKSSHVNGFDRLTGKRWFKRNNVVFDVYRMQNTR